MVPWIELSERFKESNRSQADNIIEKLAMCNLTIAPRCTWDEPLFEFDTKEVEFLAEKEHERWIEEKIKSKETHPSLLPWEELSEEEKEKDRNSVRVIPRILKKVNLKVERIHPRS